jgi:hypothetical protein
MDVKSAQLRILTKLLQKSAGTAYAKHLGLRLGMTYDEFRENVPLCTYDDLAPWVDRCKAGEPDVLWPGVVRRFAVSAGTTGAGKHIPITDDRLCDDLGFMRRVMRQVLRDNPDPGLFLGRHVALSGSVETIDGSEFGEISGMLACASPKWIRLWHSMCPEKAAHMSWPDRFEAIITNAMHSDVRVITGVPSWILILLREVSNRRGQPIEQVWPNLRLIITGGVALSGYHDISRKELGDLPVRFLENYGASEGYHSFDWYDAGSMLLQYDADIFYELVPIIRNETGRITSDDTVKALPIWEAAPAVDYGLIVTNRSGLLRYMTNDIIRFTTVDLPRIRVVGRLTDMTDTFGEAVTASDVREVIQRVLPEVTSNQIHIRPIWSGSPQLPGHEWMIVIACQSNADELKSLSLNLAMDIDQQLKSINRHYAIRRETAAMGMPMVRLLSLNDYETIIRALPKSQSKLGMFLEQMPEG